MGTPEFAVPVLDALVKEGLDIAGVVTVPDKPAGRGQKQMQSAVKKYALEHGLKVLQPANLKDPQWLAELQALQANLQVVVAFRMLPESVWKMPALGTINLHASLLPQYRGAAPINWVVINGETETGLTTFFLQHEIDTGSVIHQQKMAIAPGETAGELHDRMMKEGAVLVLKTLHTIETGNVDLKPQNEMLPGSALKSAPKLSKETGLLKKELPVMQAYNLVRGLSPYPAAVVTLKEASTGRLLNIKVFKASIDADSGHFPGEIICDNKTFLKLCFTGGCLSVTDLQAAGKNRMAIKDFLNGFKITGTWSLT